MVVTIRFWFFAVFVTALAAAPARRAAALRRARPIPGSRLARGVILIAEVCVMVVAFTKLGLIESHAVFTCYPLLVAALSGPILGEKVGWRRWSAILVGFVGVLIILQPGSGVFSPWALVPFARRAALCRLRPSDPLRRPARRRLGQLLLDRHRRRAGDLALRADALAGDVGAGLGLDGHAVLHRRSGPLAADQGLCRGRGQHGAALCLYIRFTVDGTYNSLVPGQSTSGAADTLFPRLTDPVFRNEGDDTMPLGLFPAPVITNNNYGLPGSVADADPRIISNLIVDMSVDNPAAIEAWFNNPLSLAQFEEEHPGVDPDVRPG